MGKGVILLGLVLGLFIIIIPNAGTAQGRPDSRNMTCEQARNLVRSRGAVVMSTGRFTFERVVNNVNACQYDELAVPYYAPTRDEQKCNVGNKCVPHYFSSRN